MVDYWPTFATGGEDISGANFLMLFNPSTRKLIYKFNLTTITQARYGGFQDLEFDPSGNVYIVGEYPSCILRVDSKGKDITNWYLNTTAANHTIAGFTGLAAKEWTLLASHSSEGSLFRFDMRKPRGIPHPVRISPAHKIESPDAIQLPPRYNGTVLLVAELFKGVSVFWDRKGKWEAAKYLGLVPWLETTVAVVTAPVQVGDAVYMNLIPFGSAPGGGAGNQTDFLYYDITDKVDALLAK